jgi:UDP-glucose 4-epimerase
LAIHVVTGGAGFIGSHIAEALVGRGDKVIVLDNLSTGKARNLQDAQAALELRRVDLVTEGSLEKHLVGVDTVFHLAAIPSVPLSISDPVASHETNITASLKLLIACRDAGVRRVIFASSSAVYGDNPTLPKREDMPAEPISPYGAQKYLGEIYAQVFWRNFGLETVSLRYFNVFGPRQDASSEYSGVFAKFIPSVLQERIPRIYGDGLQTRDFVYVTDVVRANLRASAAEGAAGGVFNIASGGVVTVRKVFDETRALTGKNVEVIHEPPRKGDIRHSEADISRARDILDWTPKIAFSEGLERTSEWYRGELKVKR